MLISKSLEQPRALGDSPSFPELVCFYLPSSEWTCGDTLNNSRPEYCPPGPETSIFDRYHYRLLKKMAECDSIQLDLAFEEWLRIGEYKNGESQRKNLATYFLRWGRQRELFFAIRKGLEGSQEERDVFREEREAQARVEAKGDIRSWNTWEDVAEMFDPDQETPYPPARDPMTYMRPNLTDDGLLGAHLWPRGARGNVAGARRSERNRKH
jgi:hypothetical protein